MKNRLLVVYGTRPEAIKLAPLVRGLRASEHFVPVVAVTGQHRAMLDQVNNLFNIVPDYDLNIIAKRQSLSQITTRVLEGVGKLIEQEKPEAVIVQGDTTSCLAAALASFYHKTPVVHVEAGLRTSNRYDPFPEEINRRLTTNLASLHLAPTAESKSNLLRENVAAESIVVTGNTVIDALLEVVSRPLPVSDERLEQALRAARLGRRLLLVTSHRRESWGRPMAQVASAIARVADEFPDLLVVLPAHLNPIVRQTLLPPLVGKANVLVTEPLSYADFSQVINAASVILTDSGGVQEEAPSLGKPVLVLRDTTERPEAVAAGTVKLVGTRADVVFEEVSSLLRSVDKYAEMARAVNPYGDGLAVGRCVQAIAHFFGLEGRPAEFSPSPESRTLATVRA